MAIQQSSLASSHSSPVGATPCEDVVTSHLEAEFSTALVNHQAGQLAVAESQYRGILQARPDHAAALHFLGVAMHQTNRSDEGIRLVRQSILWSPLETEWHNTLGNMLAATDQVDLAVSAFMNTLELDPRHAKAWNNLGALLMKRGAINDALLAFDSAIAIDPDFIDAFQNRGDALVSTGRMTVAALDYSQVYLLQPASDKSPRVLGIAYYALERFEEAALVYEAWLTAEPRNPIATHMLAACRGSAAPARASDAYVQMHFDDLSATFDQKLVGNLDYRVPAMTGKLLDTMGLQDHDLRILDAGCGTGLCGAVVARYSRHLTGVDLSAKSLDIAACKRLYDVLQQQEIVDYLDGVPRGSFDLVIAADLLIYFGDISGFMDRAARALAPGGMLIASFEIHESPAAEAAQPHAQGHVLKPSGRYSHRRDYLLKCFETAGFGLPVVHTLELRKELGRPVDGLLVLARSNAINFR